MKFALTFDSVDDAQLLCAIYKLGLLTLHGDKEAFKAFDLARLLHSLDPAICPKLQALMLAFNLQVLEELRIQADISPEEEERLDIFFNSLPGV